eukprot:gene13669-15099_t
MQNDLEYIVNLASNNIARLDTTCQFLDKNTETAYHCYEKIRNSNRTTKAKVKQTMARLTQLKKVAQRVMESEFQRAINDSLQDIDADMLPPDEPDHTTQQRQIAHDHPEHCDEQQIDHEQQIDDEQNDSQ